MTEGALFRPGEPGIARFPPWVVFTPYVFHDTSVRMPETDTDEVLLAAAQRGDREARDELFARCRPNMVAQACKMLGPTREDEAEDVAQAALQKADRGLDRFKGDSKVSTWIYAITRNACLDWRRTHPPRSGDVPIDDPTVGEATWIPPATLVGDVVSEATRRRQLGKLFEKAFATLPKDERTVLLLQTYKDLTNTEIAERLNWPLGTVKTRLRNAKIRMRDAVVQYGLTAEA